MRILGRMPTAAILAALWLGLLPAASGQAQAPVQVDLAPPDTSRFPEIVLYLTVRSAAGSETPVLAPQDFVILEDQLERPVTSLETVETDLDLCVVINTTTGMGVRDASGRSRLDQVGEALVHWWSDPLSTRFGTDSYTLITREGTLLERVPAAAELASTMDYLSPNLAEVDSALDLLARVLEENGPGVAPGSPRPLVFITSFVDVTGDPSLADVLGAAQEASTILYPVIVGPASLRDEPALAAWRDLAQQTGGSLVVLDPAGGMDDLARELDRLHARYRLTYPSAVSTQGAHAVQVRVVNEAIDVVSPVRTFRAEVLPPEVVFVSPPATLPLTPMEPGDVPGDGQAPTVELPLLITFPDRHPRLIVQTDLLVDGALATSKVQPPYDVVEWTLDPQVVAGGHTLQAVVVDSLGLRAESEPHTLRLVTTRAPSILETRPWLIGLMTFLLVAVAATLGLLPRLVSRPRAPAGGRTALPRLRRATLSPPDADQAEATLEPEEDDLGPIVLTGMDVTFGRDASLATHILLDPSVSPVHARLIRQVNGRYLLRDQDSLAGTWVNHEPVPPGGILLEHCDLVHFGRIGYRFRLAQDPGARQITVTPLGESGMAPAAGFPSP